jgi:F5/8 type C domain-containing protein
MAVLVAACETSPPPPSASQAAIEPSEGSSGPSQQATAPPATSPPAHRIGIRVVEGRGEFFDQRSGERFVPRGANYLHLERDANGIVVDRLFADYDPAVVETDLRAMVDLGYTAVRIGLDICQDDCIGDPAGGLRGDYLANIADFLRRAAAAGLPVLIQANDLPEQGGYVPRVEATFGVFDGYMNSQYLSPVGLGVFREYWTDVMEGLRDAGAPLDAVLAYGVRGELFVNMGTAPLSRREGIVETANGQSYDMASPASRRRMVEEGIVYWVDEMADAIRAVDPTALITVGEFTPNNPNDWRGHADGRAPPKIDVFLRTSVDFLDVHLYPGYIPIGKLIENYGATGDEAIPIVVGEYGAFKFAFTDPPTGAAGLMRWQVDSCRFGLDGWFHWHWRGTGDHEVWTGTESDDAINTVLSPRERPDPCAAAQFPFIQDNLALDATARASASLAGEGPSRAIDGRQETSWVSGAAPRQWIEIDLGKPATIETLRLVVSQSPAGRTVHVISAGPSRTALERVHTFDGRTNYGDELTWTPSTPLSGIRFLRIETTRSPSWVAWLEIEVLGRRP